MVFGSTAVALTVLSVLLGVVCFVGVMWLIPVFIQRQKANIKRKQVQKKANDEMVRNIRYRSPSTVGCPTIVSKNFDYGSTQPRLTEPTPELSLKNVDVEKNDVPSINITCEEEPLVEAQDNQSKIDANHMLEIFGEKSSLQNSKRRFSSIVFTHSDEIKVLSDGKSLEIAGDKRERRASMSLFDTCKLACPDLSQNLGRSTEHLNQMILPGDENQGKLYFSLSQNAENKRILEVVIIKITDIAEKKKNKEYILQMDLIESESNVIHNCETSARICSGEVINFDESFVMDIDGKISDESEECLFLVFTLVNKDSKKAGKVNKIGEIRFDLMELIEGQILRYDGQDQFVICRNFVNLTNKIKCKENGGKVLIFLRFSKIAPLNFVIGVSELKDLKSNKPFNSVNIRISLADETKVLESRRSKVIKKKHQTADGVLKIDESFEFNMSLHKMSSKEVPKSASGGEKVFVTLFICGRNNIGFSHVLGKCVIGPIEFADGTGLFHWNKAISNLGDIVYHLHSLKN